LQEDIARKVFGIIPERWEWWENEPGEDGGLFVDVQP